MSVEISHLKKPKFEERTKKKTTTKKARLAERLIGCAVVCSDIIDIKTFEEKRKYKNKKMQLCVPA
jgi:hypothetical protein